MVNKKLRELKERAGLTEGGARLSVANPHRRLDFSGRLDKHAREARVAFVRLLGFRGFAGRLARSRSGAVIQRASARLPVRNYTASTCASAVSPFFFFFFPF